MLKQFSRINIAVKSSNLTNPTRSRHKVNKLSEEKLTQPKLAQDVMKYLESLPEYSNIMEELPKSLLKKYKAPETMYLINRSTARDIAKTIKPHLNDHSPIVEVNPGLGYLSQELLHCQNQPLYTYEASNHFGQHLEKLGDKFRNRFNYKMADFFGMWKLAFRDKIDNGNRMGDLLGELATKDSDRIIKIIGSMPSLSFVKHLINTIVFHNSGNQLGRPDLFITMPGYYYEFLTDSDVQLRKHRSLPSLFQMFFEFKILTNVPRAHFLPWTHPPSSKRVTLMNENCLYVVNITQKTELPCPPDYLPLLWYFFKPHVLSNSTRIIPMLEQWIPGCGVWLITGQDPPDTNKMLSPGKHDAELPHMTIFTEFGDLSLKQKITVFKRFISWPEFEQCPFRVTMENNLPKHITAVEDEVGSKSGIVADIEDLEHTDTDSDTECA